MEHQWVFIGLAIMWAFFLVTWTIPSARRREPHEVLVSFGLGSVISLAILVYTGTWETRSITALQIISIPVLVIAAILALGAFHALRSKGKPTDAWETTTALVNSGVYRFARHPMYLGAALWAVGIALGHIAVHSVVLATACVALTFLASIMEDRYNLRKFGEPYAGYMKRVKLVNVRGATRER